MSLLLDGILLAVLAICIISGIRNGFIKSFMGLVKGAVSLLVAYAYTPMLRDVLKDHYIIKSIADGIAETLKSLALNLESQTPTYDLSKIAADLPEAYVNILDRYNISLEEFTAQIAGITVADESMIDSFSAQIASPCATAISTAAAFIILFLASLLVLSLVTWILDALFRLPVLSATNRFFGLVFGVLEGVLIVWSLSAAASALMSALGSLDGELFGAHVVESTVICKFFAGNNILTKITEVLQ
ncbi:MAG: CvpA family protein [Clostridia bacterium]|nr:CvpA family protein [Clostridia bacterium]